MRRRPPRSIPHGGLRDIDLRLLRAVSPASFVDDPLRILRAARFVAELGFRLDDGTVRLAHDTASRAGDPAGERQLAELRLMRRLPTPSTASRRSTSWAGPPRSCRSWTAFGESQQNPNHHLDVHGHTLEVLRRLMALETDLSEVAGDRAGELSELLTEPLADGFTRGQALRLGAILHDAGKPATREESRGYVTFIGHDHVGAEIADRFAARMRASATCAST